MSDSHELAIGDILDIALRDGARWNMPFVVMVDRNTRAVPIIGVHVDLGENRVEIFTELFDLRSMPAVDPQLEGLRLLKADAQASGYADARPVFPEPLTYEQIGILEAWDSRHGGV